MPYSDHKISTTLSILMKASEIMKNGVIWLNADGQILGVNQKLTEELNYASKEEFTPSTIYEVDPSSSMLSWKKLWKELLKQQKISFKSEHITSDNNIYPVRISLAILEIDKEPICIGTVENLMRSNQYKDLLNLTSEIASIGSWEWDLVHDEFLFTKEMYRLLELPANIKMHRKNLLEFLEEKLNKKEVTQFLDYIDLAIKEAKPFEMELSIAVRNRFESFNFQAQPVWLEDQTIKLYGTLQNLSKVSKRTDDLYFIKFCMDHARDMILWVQKDKNIFYANHTACETLNYKKTNLENQSILLLTKESNTNEFWKNQWDLLAEKDFDDYETTYFTKNGEAIPVSISPNIINYQGREFNCMFIRNLSKKKQRDDLIKMAKHSLDQSIDMIFWLNSDATFRYFNDSFVEKTGYTRKEIEQMTIVDFFPNTKMKDFEMGWQKLQEGMKLSSVDRLMKIKNGSLINTEMTVNLVKTDQNEYSSTVLRDITEKRKKEEELERLQLITQAENIELKEEIELEFNFSNIISRDPNYKKVLRQVEQVADTNATVLITGETGTGKELLARAIHKLSDRYDHAMVKVNCGALPKNLIESELFGHEKGSFTGAHQQKIGKFERAHKGTIFLDEIGELPLDLQTKLLRVLQEGEIERVGGTKLVYIDARIIAATNRNLEQEVADGKFREDLFYRLNVFPIYNIPLRERPEDIPILVKHFVDKYSKKINKPIKEISQLGLNKLMRYNFLGNVRELENLIERAVILAKGSILNFDLPLTNNLSPTSSTFETMEELQRNHILEALQRTNGKVSGKTGAAALLKMNDKTLSSRMQKLGINKLDFLKK